MVGYCRDMIAATVLLAAATALTPQQPPIQTLLVSGANNHDWQWTSPEIARVLTETGRFKVTITNNPKTDLAGVAEQHASGDLDLIVLDYNGPRWGKSSEDAFLQAVRQGCGVTIIHAADNAFTGWKEYEQMVGLLWRRGTGHGRYHPFDVVIIDHNHPITIGMENIVMHPDELYHRLKHAPGAQYQILMSAFSEPKTGGTGRHEPMVTASMFGKGHVFHTPLGHVWKNNIPSHATWQDPQLRRLIARGSEWAASGKVTISPTPLNRLSQQERKDGFQNLFDGKSIEHWTGFKQDRPPAKGWVVRDAAIVHEAKGGGGDLVTREMYGDFDFRFSFRISERGNSGVMWHVTEEGEQTYFTGAEYQVIDDINVKPGKLHGVAALYDLVPANQPNILPAGSWNQGRIVVKQGRLHHYLNGKKVVDCPCQGSEWTDLIQNSKFKNWPFGKAKEGRMALQDHGDEVAFRNLRIKRL